MRTIKLTMELIDVMEALPSHIREELREIGKYHIFSGVIIPKEDLKEHKNGYTLNRDWNSYDDFWNVIINGKEKKINIDNLISTVKSSIRDMIKLKKKLKIIKKDVMKNAV